MRIVWRSNGNLPRTQVSSQTLCRPAAAGRTVGFSGGVGDVRGTIALALRSRLHAPRLMVGGCRRVREVVPRRLPFGRGVVYPRRGPDRIFSGDLAACAAPSRWRSGPVYIRWGRWLAGVGEFARLGLHLRYGGSLFVGEFARLS